MQSLNVVFHVSLNKLLNKPAYDVTVMDDLALGGASLLSAHYVPVYLKQSCWHKFVDAAKTDRIKEVTYEICVCVYITVDAMYSQYFQSATNWKLEVWIH